MDYWNNYNENDPTSYVTYYSLEQACELLYHSTQLFACLHIIDTAPQQVVPKIYPPYSDERAQALFMWRNAVYDIGYRNAPIPDKRIQVDMSNIHEYIPEWVREIPNLKCEESFSGRTGYIMDTVEDLYYKGLRDGNSDLNRDQYAWEL